MSKISDFLAILRGAQIVANAAAKHNKAYIEHIWANSSIKEVVNNNVTAFKDYASKATSNPSKEFANLEYLIKESIERPYIVLEGVRQLLKANKKISEKAQQHEGTQQFTSHSDKSTHPTKNDVRFDAANVDISSITLKELEDLIAKKNKQKRFRSKVKEIAPTEKFKTATQVNHEKNASPMSEIKAAESYVENMMKFIGGDNSNKVPSSSTDKLHTEIEANIKVPELSSVAKQRKVPASRVGRMASFGTLFAGLGVGTLNELAKGAIGLGGARSVKEAFLSPSNAERIVDTLCKVRGAALKLGQILSIQDSNVVSPELVKAFERVRQAADYMPDWQVDRVISQELGSDWRNHLKEFEKKPFAAASIGQVHRGILNNGTQVAIKIQYPGVAQSIESDIDNLVGMLKVWDVFPKGFFIDNIVKVAKRELIWEVDYIRESEYTEKYGEMISDYKDYYVPKVIKEMTTKSVLTTELVPGIPLDKCFNLKYDHRYFIGESVLKLCLRELFQLQCMQTDPNWSNFLYDAKRKKIMLIDFGSTRFYNQDFIKNYRNVINAAVKNDGKEVLNISRQMGFLTGYESKQMEEAHVNAVMILGEMFRYDGEFDFGKQNTTKQIAQLVPTMVAHRLCPPPEEIYSIHRKLSGIFLLCARLNIRMNCKPLYEEIIKNAYI